MMKRFLSSILVFWLIALSIVAQPISRAEKSRPLNMLVLGDSIMWGQGLKPEHKSWYLVRLWLERTTGRTVVEKILAHSGALIEPGPTDDRLRAHNPEVNVARPTMNDQLDTAVSFYPDATQVDLVLLSGCGNDVGVENLLNASSAEEISGMTETKCGPPMERLLRRVAVAFPASVIIVAGYYPFFSEKSRNDFVLKGLTKRFLKVTPGAPRLSSKENLVRLTANSRAWYEASNEKLADVVQKINAELGGDRKRILFARIEFPPEYAFAAHDTRLWGFNRSPLRMMLLFLTFGKKVLPANDEVRKQRTASCKELFAQLPNETVEQKRERQKRRMLCRYASLGHPNKRGAILYSNAIIALLPAAGLGQTAN